MSQNQKSRSRYHKHRRKKALKHRSQNKSNNKTLEQQVISLHSKYGFKNQDDWEECINIHFTLLNCQLIFTCQPQLDQFIIREIALYSTGLCIDCNVCNLSNCVLFGWFCIVSCVF